jgi:hypothetical protein
MDDDELLTLQKRASNATCPTSPSNVEHRSHANNSKAPREMHGGITTPAGKGSHRGRRADDGTYSYRSPKTTRRARLFRSFPACVLKRTPRVLLPFTPVENAESVVGVRSAVPPWHSLGQLGSSCGMAGSAGRRRGTLTKTSWHGPLPPVQASSKEMTSPWHS